MKTVPHAEPMLTLLPCVSDQSWEISEYLHPIWHEVYDDIELGGPEGVEYIFTKWASGEAIRDSFSEGYVFGYVLEDGVRVRMYSYLIKADGEFYISKLYLEKMYRGRGLVIQEQETTGHKSKFIKLTPSGKAAAKAFEEAFLIIKSN